MTNNRYEPELKQKVLRLYLEEGRTKKSLTEEYNLGQGTLTYWLQQYRKECDNSSTKREESDSYEVAKKLRKEIVNNTEYSSFRMRYTFDHEEIKLFNIKVNGNVDGLSENIQAYFNKYGKMKKMIQDHKLSYDINF
ncbi:transposase [Streptococcus suis]|nr:transposase [Streptococcus suis]